MITPIILSGGAGKRLWPLSRESHPKQFLPLFDGQSLFQLTLNRVEAEGFNTAKIICNREHRFMALEQLGKTAPIIIEPCSRNTAPAVAAACLTAQPDDVLLVLPSDHLFTDTDAFRRLMRSGEATARAGHLVTFGVQPSHPATGYGYIQKAESLGELAGFTVAQFVEKPNFATAANYLASGQYLWNCGVFMFQASTMLTELEAHAPDVVAAARAAVAEARNDLEFFCLDESYFAQCPDISIDYAVMERTARAVVIPCDTAWSDVGSWATLSESMGRDEQGNVSRGDAMLVNSRNTTAISEEKLIVALGVDDLVIVETDDAILVAPHSESENIKKVVEQLQREQRSEVVSHRKIYRPWGYYDAIGEGERHKVKRIVVKPGACLSLQMHHHRAEHWIVVQGTARVTRGEESFLLTENQSTYIPLGVVHRLENPGTIALEIIEVQSGPYLGEDDIVRLEDHYGRTGQTTAKREIA